MSPGRADSRPVALVAEDDDALRSVLVRGLEQEGFHCTGLASGGELLTRARQGDADVLVIDIGLPDSDGRDVCQALRAEGIATPVLFLTARGALVDRLSGFSAGGDDYVVKPFALAELMARLQALVRRGRDDPRPTAPGMILDPSAHGMRSGERVVRLTPTEFRIAAALMARPGEAVRRRDLIQAGWPVGAIVNDNTLDAYIARLRRKLRALPEAPELETVHGVGYAIR